MHYAYTSTYAKHHPHHSSGSRGSEIWTDETRIHLVLRRSKLRARLQVVMSQRSSRGRMLVSDCRADYREFA